MNLELIVGAVLPFILEFIFRWVGEKPKLKFVVSLVIPLLVGAGLNYGELAFGDVESVLGSGAIIFGAAQGVYQLYFKDSKIQAKIRG